MVSNGMTFWVDKEIILHFQDVILFFFCFSFISLWMFFFRKTLFSRLQEVGILIL